MKKLVICFLVMVTSVASATVQPLMYGGTKWVKGEPYPFATCRPTDRSADSMTVICEEPRYHYRQVRSFGVIDYSKCPDPGLAIYAPNCEKYKEMYTLPTEEEPRWLTDEEAKGLE